MFKAQDRNRLQRYLAKKPVEAVVVLPEKVAAVAYQQPKNRLPRQQLETSMDKSDEPRKIIMKQKKQKGKQIAGGGDDRDEQITSVMTEASTETDCGKVLAKNSRKKNKKKAKKSLKVDDDGGQASTIDDITDETSEPTKQSKIQKSKQQKSKFQKASGNNSQQQNKLQQALSRDVASMIAAFHDKGFVEDDDDDYQSEDGDYDNNDLEDEVYEEDEAEEVEVEEPPVKKLKQKDEVIHKKNLKEFSTEDSEAARRSAELGAKAKQTLAASMFRSLNELLYTTDSKEVRRKFTAAQFKLYHQAYEQLATGWPLQPVDYLVEVLKKRLQKLKKNNSGFVIADVGCGSRARIAEALEESSTAKGVIVYSYDLHPSTEDSSIIAADMARLPLDSATVDVIVYSLSLMPTNLKDVLREANRVLKPNAGQMLIVEVASRFADYQSGQADRRGFYGKKADDQKEVNFDLQRFAADLKPYGFSMISTEPLPPNGYFVYLAFKKTADAETLTPKSRLPEIVLKACLYKAR